MQQVASGDRSAFDRVVVEHRDAVWRFSLALSRDRQTAEDVLQETFIAAFRGAAAYRGDAALRTWLLGLTRRQAARAHRRRAGQPAETLPLDQLGERAGWGRQADPERLVARSEDKARLRAALERLSPEDRGAILLRDIEQLPGAEAAALLGLSLPALKSRLHRARLRLMAELREEGGDVGPI